MKKIIMISISMLLVLGLVTGCGSKKEEKKEESNPVANTNEGVVMDQNVEGFDFHNTSLIYKDGTTALETTVTNVSDSTQKLREFKIHVYDKDGNEMITLTGYIGASLAAGEARVLNSYCGEDLTKATKITYEVIR